MGLVLKNRSYFFVGFFCVLFAHDVLDGLLGGHKNQGTSAVGGGFYITTYYIPI